jgi:hypothetical protein
MSAHHQRHQHHRHGTSNASEQQFYVRSFSFSFWFFIRLNNKFVCQDATTTTQYPTMRPSLTSPSLPSPSPASLPTAPNAAVRKATRINAIAAPPESTFASYVIATLIDFVFFFFFFFFFDRFSFFFLPYCYCICRSLPSVNGGGGEQQRPRYNTHAPTSAHQYDQIDAPLAGAGGATALINTPVRAQYELASAAL